jgi:hypothetical protein
MCVRLRLDSSDGIVLEVECLKVFLVIRPSSLGDGWCG